MSEETLVRHCAPTLAGIKTGNLFACDSPSVEAARRDLMELADIFQEAGLRALPLKQLKNDRVLIYMYRPWMLQADLSRPESGRILRECGYQDLSEKACIETLISHLEREEQFPHEIGLFLGYPAEDVKGFIENHGKNCKAIGTWKVYGNVERAVEQFARFEKCTRAYLAARRKGIALRRLAVKKKSLGKEGQSLPRPHR